MLSSSPLTSLQVGILREAARGHSTREIAERMELAADDVRKEMIRVIAVLEVKSKLEAVIVAMRNEWL